jgi:hypothetical protein
MVIELQRQAGIVANCLTNALRQLNGAPQPKDVGGVKLTAWAFLRAASLYLNEELETWRA